VRLRQSGPGDRFPDRKSGLGSDSRFEFVKLRLIELQLSRQETESFLAESEQLLEARNAKLAEAQQAQAEALRKQRELDEKARELEVTIEKRVQASQAELVAKARQDVTDELKSQVSQKDAQIDSLGPTVEELKRKLEQGSQQTQGEAFELELESLLRGKFPLDLIEPVAKFTP
jgi:hypothetical protein